jgi:preprotein translocase subunit YajC
MNIIMILVIFIYGMNFIVIEKKKKMKQMKKKKKMKNLFQ